MKPISQYIIIIAVIGIIILASVFCYLKKDKIADNTIKNTNSIIFSEKSEDSLLENNFISNESQTASLLSIEDEKFNNSMKSAANYFAKKDYKLSIREYKKAIAYKNMDTAHAGLSSVYAAQNDWKNAQIEIDKAISLEPTYSDYWKWKLTILDEKTETNFDGLKQIYLDGLTKVNQKTKINLVVHFAKIAENNFQYIEVISLWQEAINLYPKGKDIYQAEIDRIKSR